MFETTNQIIDFSGFGKANVIVFWRAYHRFSNPSAISNKNKDVSNTTLH